MPSVELNVQSAKTQMISAPISRMSAVRRPEGEIRYVFIYPLNVVTFKRCNVQTCLEHRKLLHVRLIGLGRRGRLTFGSLTLGLSQKLRQAPEIRLNQRPVLCLMQRGRRVHHRNDQPAADPARLAVNARDLLTRKPSGHREAPECDDHP